MQRRKFVLTGLALTPLAVFAKPPAIALQNEQKPFIVPAGAARNKEKIFFRGVHPNDCKISGKDTNGVVAIFEYTGLAQTGPSMHLHYEQDEIFYVVEGRYRFVVADEIILAAAGDTVFLPRKVPHTWIQLTEKGKMIYQVQPAGKMEDFFRLMNGFRTAPTKDEIEKIHLDHGMKSVGPPLSL